MKMTEEIPKYYWDACAWIGFINNEPNKTIPLRVIWDRAVAGECKILTSTYSYMEVIYGINALGEPYPPEQNDAIVFDMLAQPHVDRIQFDTEVAKMARALKRKYHPVLGKRPDAVHLASACYHNVTELHTFDGNDLLPLTGLVHKRDGKLLTILAPGPETHGPLFAEQGNGTKAPGWLTTGPAPPI